MNTSKHDTAQLPECAYIDNRLTRRVEHCSAPVLKVMRNLRGYEPVYRAGADADALNGAAGVTPAQREAMFAGSLFGWSTALADPAAYRADGTVDHGALIAGTD